MFFVYPLTPLAITEARDSKDLFLFRSLWNSLFLNQCLAQSSHSIHICSINGWTSFFFGLLSHMAMGKRTGKNMRQNPINIICLYLVDMFGVYIS